MKNVIVITTEGDCEGRTTQTVGYFTGSIEQIMTYCLENNIKPYYHFKAYHADVVDCSRITPRVSVTTESFGRLQVKASEVALKEQKRKQALSKLTREERDLLGL